MISVSPEAISAIRDRWLQKADIGIHCAPNTYMSGVCDGRIECANELDTLLAAFAEPTSRPAIYDPVNDPEGAAIADAYLESRAEPTTDETPKPRPTKEAKQGNRTITLILTDWFCPSCGKRDMWQDTKDGSDYYHDCGAVCGSCGYVMCCIAKFEEKPHDS